VNDWRRLLRPGDYLVIALTAALCAALAPLAWRGGKPEKAVLRANGEIFAEVDLAAKKTLQVPGPLGPTTILVEHGRARVVADPGPRQYCVLQGWLTRAGDVAVCAPNRVSLQIVGRTAAYDSLAY
jgi:hypothetical protein